MSTIKSDYSNEETHFDKDIDDVFNPPVVNKLLYLIFYNEINGRNCMVYIPNSFSFEYIEKKIMKLMDDYHGNIKDIHIIDLYSNYPKRISKYYAPTNFFIRFIRRISK